VVIFFADWILVDLSIANGDYEIIPGIYVGNCCIVVILAHPFYKLLGNRCHTVGMYQHQAESTVLIAEKRLIQSRHKIVFITWIGYARIQVLMWGMLKNAIWCFHGR